MNIQYANRFFFVFFFVGDVADATAESTDEDARAGKGETDLAGATTTTDADETNTIHLPPSGTARPAAVSTGGKAPFIPWLL